MDEKVLDVLIERVEKSAQMEFLHKNESWGECLKSDKKQLKEYCLKNSEKSLELNETIKSNIRKSGYMGSSERMNSGKGNVELIPQNSHRGEKLVFYKFDFRCFRSKSATVIVNGIIYDDRNNLSRESIKDPIHSFVVVTPDIDYTWIGAYYAE